MGLDYWLQACAQQYNLTQVVRGSLANPGCRREQILCENCSLGFCCFA